MDVIEGSVMWRMMSWLDLRHASWQISPVLARSYTFVSVLLRSEQL